MTQRRQVGFQSALLVSIWVIIGSFVASMLAFWGNVPAVAALLLTVSAVGLVSRLWGEISLHRVQAQVSADRQTVSVGQTMSLRYTIENNKALPLIWLELCQDIPVRDCLTPADGFVRREYSAQEAQYTGRGGAWMRRFPFVMGFHRLEWETVWRAERRGVYRPKNFVLRSGDAFGLTQSTGEAEGLSGQIFVVWPKIIPVRTEPFLRNVWTGVTGKAGWTEDPTVMRGERDYQPGDPWKRIDWRIAARTGELMVRQFDTVMPLSGLFILDAAALIDREEAISLLASILLALGNAGVSCGLALPATKSAPPVLLRPDDPSVTRQRLLFALSDFDAEGALPGQDDRNVEAAAMAAGQVWLVTERAAESDCPALAARLSANGLRFLCRSGEGALSFERVKGAPL